MWRQWADTRSSSERYFWNWLWEKCGQKLPRFGSVRFNSIRFGCIGGSCNAFCIKNIAAAILAKTLGALVILTFIPCWWTSCRPHSLTHSLTVSLCLPLASKLYFWIFAQCVRCRCEKYEYFIRKHTNFLNFRFDSIRKKGCERAVGTYKFCTENIINLIFSQA